jgi:non-specific serine/threonine protein kinase
VLAILKLLLSIQPSRRCSLESVPKKRRNIRSCNETVEQNMQELPLGSPTFTRRYALGAFTLDAEVGVLLHEGQPVALGARGVAVLHALVRHAPQFVSKDLIVDTAWLGLVVEESNLSVQISAIRRALAVVPGAERWLETLPRRGYRYVGPLNQPAQAKEEPLPAPVAGRAGTEPLRPNLPELLTSFVGRQAELVEVQRRLQQGRLLTLVGAGGVGKTRLALRLAGEQLPLHADGVWLVELAPLVDPVLVPQAVATALGVKEQVGRPLQETLVDHLRSLKALLVLDNAEHLLVASAQLAETMLQHCPQVRVLVTSRERLGIAGEHTYRVPSLPLPEAQADMERIRSSEAVQLFVERVRLQQAAFALTQDNAQTIAALCRRLDGIPLALELAAGRIRSMTVQEVLVHLNERFRVLTGGSRTAPRRQQTLRALIDWSHDLLDAQERSLLHRLSVFAGGCSLDAAESVCSGGGIQTWEVLDLLTALVDKSLVTVEIRLGETRYGMLESLRDYAREHLVEQASFWQTRHLHFFAGWANEMEPQIRGPRQKEILDRIDADYANVIDALALSLRIKAETVQGMTLAASIWFYWYTRGQMAEGVRWLELFLSHASAFSVPDIMRAKSQLGLSQLMERRGNVQLAHVHAQQALQLFRAVGYSDGISDALRQLGFMDTNEGEYLRARSQLDEALSLARASGSKTLVANVLSGLGGLQTLQGDYALAKISLGESLAITRSFGTPRAIAVNLFNLARNSYFEGDFKTSRRLNEELVDTARTLGDSGLLVGSIINLAGVCTDLKDFTAARVLYSESLQLCGKIGDGSREAISYVGFGELLVATGEYATALEMLAKGLERVAQLNDKRTVAIAMDFLGFACRGLRQERQAARLWGTADKIRSEIGSPRPPGEQEHFVNEQKVGRLVLGNQAFDLEFQQGQEMAYEEAIAFGLTLSPAK